MSVAPAANAFRYVTTCHSNSIWAKSSPSQKLAIRRKMKQLEDDYQEMARFFARDQLPEDFS